MIDNNEKYVVILRDMDTPTDMAGLPALPLTDDLLEHPAYASERAGVVRAHLRLMRGAWQAVPAGTLLDDDAVLAGIAGLSRAEFEEAKTLLLSGWQRMATGRWAHPGLVARAEAIWAVHGDALRERAARAMAVSIEPEAFCLTAPAAPSEGAAGGKSRAKRKHPLPPNFSLTSPMWDAARRMGFSDEQIRQVFDLFCMNARAKAWQYVNWSDAFALFAKNAPRMNGIVPEASLMQHTASAGSYGVTPGLRAAPSKNAALDQQNHAAVARVSALRGRAQ
ncbi:hypothetical protein [Burkholderia sp. BCC1995]|uniref:hypothetical protein n=1 Tax=Burkholderia sp. BCC1995 TaxID=2817445 RepID=UPI002ABE0EC4|nr:hypothetical protein [Burkholderia sp. BCC1995]